MGLNQPWLKELNIQSEIMIKKKKKKRGQVCPVRLGTLEIQFKETHSRKQADET